MAEFTIVRHGQANSIAQNEEDYDQLSPLGQKQAEKLKSWLDHSRRYNVLIHGSLQRQRQTAHTANAGKLRSIEDGRLNELDYFGMAHSMRQRRGLELPHTEEAFFKFMLQLTHDWVDGALCSHLEPYEHFKERILHAACDAVKNYQSPLLVSSGGVIAMFMHLAIGGELRNLPSFMSKVAHTSLHRFSIDAQDQSLRVISFSALPHFENEGTQWVTYT